MNDFSCRHDDYTSGPVGRKMLLILILDILSHHSFGVNIRECHTQGNNCEY